MSRHRVVLCSIGLLLLVSLSQFAGAALIYAKAWLAPLLIARAYAATDAQGQAAKPWPWADTRPVARLSVARLNLQRMVLDGDSGHALAFGPGMAAGSRPGSDGLVMVAGHRDTHFRFLRELRSSDVLVMEYRGQQYEYQVEQAVIADARDGQIQAPLPARGLLLVTCYPFDAIVPGGPLRYVVIARDLHSGTTAL